jgi:hypothetical protein
VRADAARSQLFTATVSQVSSAKSSGSHRGAQAVMLPQ